MRLKNLMKTGLMIFVSLLFLDCSSDSNSMENNTQKNNIENDLKKGVWMVSKYLDDGVDETYHFNGYEFTFEDGGVLTATNGVNTYSGSWSVADDNDDNSQNDYNLVIFFAGPVDFEELSDDWDIITHNSNTIELYDVSGGNGTTDYLTFQKM